MKLLRGSFAFVVGMVVATCYLACVAVPAEAATHTLFASPAGVGAANCTSVADACPIATAVSDANAEPTSDSVVIKLAGGTYSLGALTPTALPITFTGPSLTLEAEGANATLDGEDLTQLMTVADGSTVTIKGLELANGNTTGLGGAIGNSGSLVVEGSTIVGNTAANGGAVTNMAGGTFKAIDSTFSDNTTTSVGGGALIAFAPTTILRSAFFGNSAPTNGGAINVQPNGTVTIAASTLSDNTANLGGAVSNLGTLNIESSTIAGNSAPSGGSALATGNQEATFAADLIAAQAEGTACSPSSGGVVDAGYNLDTDGTCISATTPATGSHAGTTAYGSSTYAEALDAFLAPGLAKNGGPTQTISLLNTAEPPTSLADPAFDVVPPSFGLPAPVEGVSTACSLGDQRGVVALAGANCAIGSYLLQATSTAVSAPAEVLQGEAVTYTATTSPAADGGTVSFDDGAGGIATSQCAARPVAAGKATCTVTYPSTGTFSASASYTGDGAMNNFAPSASSTSATMTVKARPPAPPAPKVALKITYNPNHAHKPNPAGGPRYTFRFVGHTPGLTFYCKLDKGPFKRCKSPKVYRQLKRGRHVFKVKARDASGQFSAVSTVKFTAGRRR